MGAFCYELIVELMQRFLMSKKLFFCGKVEPHNGEKEWEGVLWQLIWSESYVGVAEMFLETCLCEVTEDTASLLCVYDIDRVIGCNGPVAVSTILSLGVMESALDCYREEGYEWTSYCLTGAIKRSKLMAR